MDNNFPGGKTCARPSGSFDPGIRSLARGQHVLVSRATRIVEITSRVDANSNAVSDSAGRPQALLGVLAALSRPASPPEQPGTDVPRHESRRFGGIPPMVHVRTLSAPAVIFDQLAVSGDPDPST